MEEMDKAVTVEYMMREVIFLLIHYSDKIFFPYFV